MQSVVSCIETICQHCACYTFYFVWIGVFRDTVSKQAPVDPALSGHHRGAEGRERRRVEGGCYSCGASRCSLIVPVVCAASNFNPPSIPRRWSCQLHYGYEMIKTPVSKATTDNLGLVR